jgi:PIN domain nuclease of toxin-antitoxin system
MAAVLDAFPLVALALGEPAAEEVELVLRRGDAVVSGLNLSEAIDQLSRVFGHEHEQVREAFGPLIGDGVRVVPFDEAAAWRAAELRGRHYRRRTSELSLADCTVIAAASAGDSIVTADGPLARAARAEELDVIALPDSRGRRP